MIIVERISVMAGAVVARQPGAARRLVTAGVLLAGFAAGEATGQPGGLFRTAAPTTAAQAPDTTTTGDSFTLRRRLVSIDFGQLAPAQDAAAAGPPGTARPLGRLQLNLFDDASFTGMAARTAPTFSGGYSVSGGLLGVEMGTMTLVVNGDVVAGAVRTPDATYRIRPAGNGLHVISQIDPSRLPPPGEPIPRRRGRERPPSEFDISTLPRPPR